MRFPIKPSAFAQLSQREQMLAHLNGQGTAAQGIQVSRAGAQMAVIPNTAPIKKLLANTLLGPTVGSGLTRTQYEVRLSPREFDPGHGNVCTPPPLTRETMRTSIYPGPEVVRGPLGYLAGLGLTMPTPGVRPTAAPVTVGANSSSNAGTATFTPINAEPKAYASAETAAKVAAAERSRAVTSGLSAMQSAVDQMNKFLAEMKSRWLDIQNLTDSKGPASTTYAKVTTAANVLPVMKELDTGIRQLAGGVQTTAANVTANGGDPSALLATASTITSMSAQIVAACTQFAGQVAQAEAQFNASGEGSTTIVDQPDPNRDTRTGDPSDMTPEQYQQWLASQRVAATNNPKANTMLWVAAAGGAAAIIGAALYFTK